MRECAHPPCVLEATKDQWCWYHAKVAAGLCDPLMPSLYRKAVIDTARRTEASRLRQELVS